MEDRKTEIVLILCMICFSLGWYKDFFNINKLFCTPPQQYEEIIWTEENTASAIENGISSDSELFSEESSLQETEELPVKPSVTSKPQTAKSSLSYDGATVYVTKSGTKYHRPDCSSLAKSKIEMLYEVAMGKGYEPCGKCKP